MPLLALIFGIGGFFFSLLCSIPAIILGVMGRKKAKELNQPTSMATAGLVLGIIVTVISLLSMVLLIPIFGLAITKSGGVTTSGERAMAKSNVAAIVNVIQNGTDVGAKIVITPTQVSYATAEAGSQTINLGGAKVRKVIGTEEYEVCQPVPANNPSVYVWVDTKSFTPSESTKPCW